MDQTNTQNHPKITLLDEIIGRIDIGRLIIELDKLDNFFKQTELRTPGVSISSPKTTASLEKLADQNKLSLLKKEDRKLLISQLTDIKQNSPKIHISFAVEPQPVFAQKIVNWIRKNIHPQALIEIGLQPNISIGCIIRTTNRIFDMSLKQRFNNSKKILHDSLKEQK